MMNEQRRTSLRKAPERLTYINLQSGYAGIVRDISDGGLRFRVIDPLQESEQVHFWFVANFSRIGGTGDLVWMDETKQTGGLRFTQLSEESREQIRSWLDESNLPHGIGEDSTPDVAAKGTSSLSNQSDQCTVPPAVSEPSFRPAHLQNAISVSSQHGSRPPTLRWNISKKSALALLQTHFGAKNRRSFKAVYAVILAIVIAALSYIYFREARELRNWLGRRTFDRGQAQTSQQVAPQPPRVTTPGSAGMNEARSPLSSATAIEASLPKPLAPREAFVIQISAVRSEADTRMLIESLRQNGFPAFVRNPTVDGFYRILVGPYQDRESARIAQHELESAGYKPFVRH
jgi:septal ring-binding cell division protein DamX